MQLFLVHVKVFLKGLKFVRSKDLILLQQATTRFKDLASDKDVQADMQRLSLQVTEGAESDSD